MAYSTKEFCALCSVGRETLRHYENLGFLSPCINTENHYRSYDEWDASIIADIKRYQSLGFSLEEIRKILSEHTLSKLIESEESMISLYEAKIRYYRMLYEKCKEELNALKMIPQLLGKTAIMDVPGFVFISEKNLKKKPLNDNDISAMQQLDFFLPCLHIDHGFSGNEADQNYSGWGLIAKREYANGLNFKGGDVHSSIRAICTILDAGDKGNISKSLFSPFVEAIGKTWNHPNIDLYAALLARTHDNNGKYHRYLFVFAVE